MTKIQNIGVLTSGGDAPGMNACIRAVVRQGIADHYKIFGIYDGFNGLIDDSIKELKYQDVSNIIQRGGTILGTARSERFLDPKHRKLAFDNLKRRNIDALVIIGGDGSFKGAQVFYNEFKLPFIGIPGTIDNDIDGTEYTIGFDTALNNIITAIDKIKDTASSHHRIFLVEVMGNNSGMLAINAALVVGAEEVFIPEEKEDFQRFENKIKLAVKAKKSSIIIVSEGDEIGGAKELYDYLKEKNLHQKIRVAVLGHIQRGGAPSFIDRIMGTNFGVQSIKAFNDNQYNIIIGIKDGNIHTYQLKAEIKKIKRIDTDILNTIHTLSVY